MNAADFKPNLTKAEKLAIKLHEAYLERGEAIRQLRDANEALTKASRASQAAERTCVELGDQLVLARAEEERERLEKKQNATAAPA